MAVMCLGDQQERLVIEPRDLMAGKRSLNVLRSSAALYLRTHKKTDFGGSSLPTLRPLLISANDPERRVIQASHSFPFLLHQRVLPPLLLLLLPLPGPARARRGLTSPHSLLLPV